MKKLVFIWIISSFILFLFLNTVNVSAVGVGGACNPTAPSTGCDANLGCQVTDPKVPQVGKCTSAIKIEPPKQGFATLGNAISNLFNIALVVAILIVLVMLILGAYEWIVSGGDKENVSKARNRILNALIGLVILAIAFALARLAGQIAGFNIFDLQIPAPDPGASGL